MNVTGDCNPAKLRTHFRGLEGLEKGAGERKSAVCADRLLWKQGVTARTIGKDPIAVEIDSTGHNHCSHYSEDGAEVILVLTSFRNFSAKTRRRERLEVCYRYIMGAVAFLPLQDSRPHVLFGTVIVKHLLDLISSCPQPV